MTKRSTIQLQEELERTIDYFRTEGRLTYAELLGVLELIKFNLLMETPAEWIDEEEGGQG